MLQSISQLGIELETIKKTNMATTDTTNTLLMIGDLKDELDKEKESQSAIKRKIEEETKQTGNIINHFYEVVCCVEP